jgi:hypothetical protein
MWHLGYSKSSVLDISYFTKFDSEIYIKKTILIILGLGIPNYFVGAFVFRKSSKI